MIQGEAGKVKEIKVYLHFLNLFLHKPTRRVQPHSSTSDCLPAPVKGILHVPAHQPHCCFFPLYP